MSATDQPVEPTQADAMHVGQAAAAAAAAAPPEQRQAAAATAVEVEADRRNLRISNEDKQEIAKMAATMAAQMIPAATVDEFDKRGAFDQPPPPQAAPEVQQAQQAQQQEVKVPVKETWAKRHGFV